MNKPIGIRTADIYLRFPEIMEEECDDLADFLEEEHIVYEGATDVFIEKDKEIENLKCIISSTKEDFLNANAEVDRLKELYRRTCRHLFEIGNEELALYFQAQINDCPSFVPQDIL